MSSELDHQFMMQALEQAKLAAQAEPASTEWPGWMHRVQQHYPGWRSIQLQNSMGTPNKDGIIPIAVKYGTQRQTTRALDIKLDTRSGQIIEERGWSSNEGSLRARSLVRLGHTGEFFGNWGQLLGLIACLAGLVLVYTGFALSWRRFFGAKAD